MFGWLLTFLIENSNIIGFYVLSYIIKNLVFTDWILLKYNNMYLHKKNHIKKYKFINIFPSCIYLDSFFL